MAETLKIVRRRYAEHVCALAGTDRPELVRAFATVPREAFAGPAPWRISTPPLPFEATSDPRHLYRNVVISLDEAKSLNNGQPSFWATLFDRIAPQPGERAIHVGAGGGYYTAILAELVAWNGWVTGIEYEPAMATAAARALADRPNVEVLAGDAHALVDGPADIIVASCGLDAVPVRWVRLLRDGGRLLVPLTVASGMAGIGMGAMLLVSRRGEAFDAAFVSIVWIYHDMGGRSDAASQRLAAAFPPASRGGPWHMPQLVSLRLDTPPDATCWLAGDGWWLSTEPA